MADTILSKFNRYSLVQNLAMHYRRRIEATQTKSNMTVYHHTGYIDGVTTGLLKAGVNPQEIAKIKDEANSLAVKQLSGN